MDQLILGVPISILLLIIGRNVYLIKRGRIKARPETNHKSNITPLRLVVILVGLGLAIFSRDSFIGLVIGIAMISIFAYLEKINR